MTEPARPSGDRADRPPAPPIRQRAVAAAPAGTAGRPARPDPGPSPAAVDLGRGMPTGCRDRRPRGHVDPEARRDPARPSVAGRPPRRVAAVSSHRRRDRLRSGVRTQSGAPGGAASGLPGACRRCAGRDGPAAARGAAPGAAGPPPPPDAPRPPRRVDPVAGHAVRGGAADVPPVTSGLAVGSPGRRGRVDPGRRSLVICFGVPAEGGWGALGGRRVHVLGVLAGAAAVVAGLLGLRQIRGRRPPPAVRFTGRGLAWPGSAVAGRGCCSACWALGLALLLALGRAPARERGRRRDGADGPVARGSRYTGSEVPTAGELGPVVRITGRADG